MAAASPGSCADCSCLDYLSHTRLTARHTGIGNSGVVQDASLLAHCLHCFYCKWHRLSLRVVVKTFLPLHRVPLSIRALISKMQSSSRIPLPRASSISCHRWRRLLLRAARCIRAGGVLVRDVDAPLLDNGVEMTLRGVLVKLRLSSSSSITLLRTTSIVCAAFSTVPCASLVRISASTSHVWHDALPVVLRCPEYALVSLSVSSEL